MTQPKDSATDTAAEKAVHHKRWYDHDPVLIEVLDLLRSFQDDVRVQAQLFLEKIEAQVGKDALDQFYDASRPAKFGNRWYDKDPVVSKAVELLRVVPPDAQRRAAMKFLESMKKQGISPDLMQPAASGPDTPCQD